eukprot:3435600-Rhodomonas_salina.11
MSGTDLDFDGIVQRVCYAMSVLRFWYAKSGTDILCAALPGVIPVSDFLSAYARAMRCPVLSQRMVCGVLSAYARTDLAYGVLSAYTTATV